MPKVRITCPTDGFVEVRPSDVTVVVRDSRNQCVFRCPVCGTNVGQEVSEEQVSMLESVHVKVIRPHAGDTVTYNGFDPFTPPRPDLYDRDVELTPQAPPITKEELLDFHEGLTDDAIAAWAGGET